MPNVYEQFDNQANPYAQFGFAGDEFTDAYRQNMEAAHTGGVSFTDGMRQQSQQLEKDTAATEHSLDDVLDRRTALYAGAAIAAAAMQPEIAAPLYSWAAGAGLQSAAALTADVADTAISSKGQSWVPESPVMDIASGPVAATADVLLPVAGAAVDAANTTIDRQAAKLGAKSAQAVSNLMDRYPLTRQTAAYLHGKTGWLDSTIGKETYRDAVPLAADNTAGLKDRLSAEASLQHEASRAMNETFTRRYFAQLGDSYLAAPMKTSDYGAGKTPAQALYWLRKKTGGYSTEVLSHPSTVPGFEHLSGVPDVEANLRADLPWLDEAIQTIDNGGKVDKEWLGQKLGEHNKAMAREADDLMRQWNKTDLASLVRLMKDIPDIEALVDWEGITGTADRERVIKSMREARKLGLRDATKAYAADSVRRIDEELLEQTAALKQADREGEAGAVTAINHHITALRKMRDDFSQYIETGDFSASLGHDEEAMLTAAGQLHHEAAHGLSIYERYKDLRATYNALPLERPATFRERLFDKGADAVAIAALKPTGGLSYLLRNDAKALARESAGKARGIKKLIVKKKVAKAAQQAVQEISHDN